MTLNQAAFVFTVIVVGWVALAAWLDALAIRISRLEDLVRSLKERWVFRVSCG